MTDRKILISVAVILFVSGFWAAPKTGALGLEGVTRHIQATYELAHSESEAEGIFSKIFEMVGSIAVILALITVIYAIATWRRDMRRKKECDLVEESMALFYEARDKLRYIRNPLHFVEEKKSRFSHPRETPEESRVFDRAHIVALRYDDCDTVFNRLFTLRYRFRALFSPRQARYFDELRDIVNEISESSRRLGQLWLRYFGPDQGGEKPDDSFHQAIKRYEELFWERQDDDSINIQVNQIVAEMEEFCHLVISREKQPRKSYRDADL